MKSRFLAAASVAAILAATGVGRADELSDLKAQAAALQKQNAALAKRIAKLERRQAVDERKLRRKQVAAAGATPSPNPNSFLGMVTKGPMEVLDGDGPLSWNGITLFGTFDAGLGWVSHGLPENGKNYEGQSLINKYTRGPRFGIAQNNLSQTTLGIKGEHEILPGLDGVFLASTGINPQSGQLADMPGTLVDNQGLPRSAYSFSGDGGRGGQAFNDQLFAGLHSVEFGQLTFGRHRSFTTDMVGAYDPAGGAYAFSPIGFNGQLLAGLGATEDARWDDSLKYRIAYGPLRFGAMYKFSDGNGGCNYVGTPNAPTTQTCYAPHNDAYQFDLGATYGGFDIDAVYGVFHQAVVIAGGNAPLSAAQLAGASLFTSNAGVVTASTTASNAGTLQANISDDQGAAVAAKYAWEQFKFFAGYDFEQATNPHDNLGIGATNDQGGYILSTVNNFAYPHAKILQTEWTGVRYAYDPRTEIAFSLYHTGQNQYGTAAQDATCSAKTQRSKAPQCAGDLYAGSLYVDYHFTKRLDAYGGVEVSNVEGGLASGFNYYTNWAPTAGVRYSF